MDSNITDLNSYRTLMAHRKLAALVAKQLSTIPCEEHGGTAVAVAEVDDDGDCCFSYSVGPCCSAHAARLRVAHDRIRRELMVSSGYLRALLIAAVEDTP